MNSNKHIGLWATLILLLAALIGGGVYVFMTKTSEAEAKDAEKAAWLRVKMFEGEVIVDSLEVAIHFYQDHFPMGQHIEQVNQIAKKLSIEKAAWAKAQNADEVDEMEEFILNHSDSYFREAANAKLDSLAYIEASLVDTYDSYQLYIDSFADGRYADEARDKMDRIDAGNLTCRETDGVEMAVIAHFFALEQEDTEKLLATVTKTLDNYIGMNGASAADVVEYMRSIHLPAGRSVAFRIKNIVVSKTVSKHIPTYTASFVLDETVHLNGDTADKGYLGSATVNNAFMIESLTLMRNS